MTGGGPHSRVELTGRPASPGLSFGPVVQVRQQVATVRKAGSADEERVRLADAIAMASDELGTLVGEIDDPEAAAILEFQLAMLSDDALCEGSLAAIAAGVAADQAWAQSLDEMIADYRATPDEYFQARASDLEDMASRVTGHLTGAGSAVANVPPGGILLARDLTPSAFLGADWSEGRAIALSGGSPTAHVAILARSRGVPMVVGLGEGEFGGHESGLLDANTGRLILSPDSDDIARHQRAVEAASGAADVEKAQSLKPAVTADGEAVKVMINAGDPAELAAISVGTTDGIGLVRSEFLFHGRKGLPGEAEQYDSYRRLLFWAEGRPVVLRTLDAGGDKPIPGLTRHEDNPFLGLRGVRLSLARPDVFRVQIRAILRAATDGDLRVMVPMVALPGEMLAVRQLFAEEAAALVGSGVSYRMPPLGMMVEVPAAALTLDLFAADFFSIGSNDLTQYVMAASRDATDLAGLDDASVPAVQRLIRQIVDEGRRLGIPVSLCGDAGSDARVLPLLLEAGLRSLSVSPAAVGRVKRMISDYHAGAGAKP